MRVELQGSECKGQDIDSTTILALLGTCSRCLVRRALSSCFFANMRLKHKLINETNNERAH